MALRLYHILALTFYIWVSWWESSSVPLVLELSSRHGNSSSTAGILTQPHPNHQICSPKLSSFPYCLRPLWEQLRHSPFSPQKALYSNNGFFIPSWSMWNHESWHLNQSSDGGVIFLWEVILSENRQSSRITSTVRKATRSLEGRLGNCTVSLHLDGYWSEQAPKPSLPSC